MVEMLKIFLIVLSCGIFLSGCILENVLPSLSSFVLSEAKVWLEKVKFKVSDQLNQNSPVSLHLLFIQDLEVLAKLSVLPADLYFKKEKQFRKDFADKIDWHTWEITPGQHMEDQTITPSKSQSLAILVFARYNTPGDHRAIIGGDRECLIDLDRLDFSIKTIR